MTSLAYIPTPAAAVDTPAVDTPAVPTRHERPALTESIFVRLAGCHMRPASVARCNNKRCC